MMDSSLSNLNDESKIKLALSYENLDIIVKFCNEYNVEQELGEEYFLEVKKFLYLCANTTLTLAPSAEIDKIWHTFILFTKDYRQYCIQCLGKFIDHVPEVKKDNTEPKENCLANTINQYKIVFGELNNEVWQVLLLNKNNEVNCSEENEDDCTNSACKTSCEEESSCSSCESKKHSCVYTGNCFDCTQSGQSCVGENPNDM